MFLASTAAMARTQTITVQRGDTVYSLARRHGVTPQSIISQNNLKAPYTLLIGQRLRITAAAASGTTQTPRAAPAAAARPAPAAVRPPAQPTVRPPAQPARTPAQAARTPPPANQNPATYRVVRGDSVYSISRRFSVAPNELMRLNNLSNPTLHVGQTLRIPQARAEPAPAQTQPARTPAQAARTPPPANQNPATYRVVRGDSVYSISRRFSVAPNELMRLNNLSNPTLHVGQTLRIPQARAEQRRPAAQQAAQRSPFGRPEARAGGAFMWPVQGKILRNYGVVSHGQSNDGINIAARFGEDVRAAENGIVVYADSGLRSFGNLILIKHADGFITAYGHNDKLLVKKGDNVKKGQTIALAGTSGGVDVPQVHFSVRRGVQSVNPMLFLSN
ncbi:MAG: LysM peptidoglycan-binding domain-containing protein [Alphaproteobacteria bacterium]|nr:LysM peptidoglycan-binding domain-containing protein [Alphaproteobacteria bacterium]